MNEKTLEYLIELEPKNTRKKAIQFTIELYCKLLPQEKIEMMTKEQIEYEQNKIYNALTKKYQTTKPVGLEHG